ncbi:hypothetical protein GA0070609_5727 [Micromonospora echinaurantiaca]|uniref:Uncharacterized protein n=1 Tax=Micromonospora echinaurantiaca TaxID=47857 RepID=A0A1C5K8D6_9ACTN|nr:hypothetical protein [Micromonospora echinaurantiaca]SCG78930.1 hypothetical protein GA0070609_5727 [Micromonospora echinaurantiaca]
MRKFRTLLGVTLAGACALAVVPGTASAAPAAPQQAAAALEDTTGAFYPLAPARLLDTRSGVGAPAGAIGAGKKVDLLVAGRGGVPAVGAGAVVLNVTITGPTASSFVTAYPAGEARPNASSINFPKGWLGSNNVTVKLGSGGKVSVYNHSGSTHVVVDVVGFYAADNGMTNRNGSEYQAYIPQRMFDTRYDGTGKMPADSWIDYAIDFGPENANVRSLVINLTAVSPAKAGFLTAWSGAGSRPTASTVNYGAGKVVPNLAFVQTRPCYEDWCSEIWGAPMFRVYTSQSAHFVTDLVGMMDDGSLEYGMRFKPVSPTRIADSRIGQGYPSILGPGAVRAVATPSELLTETTDVLAMNMTAVAPTNNTVITVWPAGYGDLFPKPDTSNLNPAAGQTVSGAVLTPIGPASANPPRAFNTHNLSGNVHMIADVVGTFYFSEPVSAATAAALKAGIAAPVAGKASRASTGS